MSETKLKIVYRDPSTIKFYQNNARVHSEEQVAEIADSIEEYGFNDPVDIDAQGVSIAGEGRIRAALKLGLKEIPTVSLAHLSDRQKKGYILAHNRIALNSSWDLDKLAAELDELVGLDVDVSILGFNEQELDGLLKQDPSLLPNEPVQPNADAEPAAGKRKAKSKILHKCPKCGEEFTAE